MVWKRGSSRTGSFGTTDVPHVVDPLLLTPMRMRLMQALRSGLQVHYLGQWVRARSDRVTIDRLVIALKRDPNLWSRLAFVPSVSHKKRRRRFRAGHDNPIGPDPKPLPRPKPFDDEDYPGPRVMR